jgi:hypothetical protein
LHDFCAACAHLEALDLPLRKMLERRQRNIINFDCLGKAIEVGLIGREGMDFGARRRR